MVGKTHSNLRQHPPGDRQRAAAVQARSSMGRLVQQIASSVVAAIIDGRLAPGAKIGEQKLASLFGASRTIARQALQQLALQKLVTLEPAKGAFVAIPSPTEAREVFAVRRVLEVAFTRQFAQDHSAAALRALKAHLRAERIAIRDHDVASRSNLLADFHIIIAKAHGNQVLAQILTDLLARSALITLVYQSNRAAEHSSDEHAQLLQAIEARDGERAAQLMDSHLRHVEEGLLDRRRAASADIAIALAPRSLSELRMGSQQ